ASARSEILLTKIFSGRASSEMWFEWARLPADMGVEARLSRLARWVMLAEERGLRYGLKLPAASVPLGEGFAHRERCLRELALYEGGGENAPAAAAASARGARRRVRPVGRAARTMASALGKHRSRGAPRLANRRPAPRRDSAAALAAPAPPSRDARRGVSFVPHQHGPQPRRPAPGGAAVSQTPPDPLRA